MTKELLGTERGPTDEPVGKRRGVTWRSVLVGLIVAVLNAYWVQHVEALQAMMLSTAISLLMNAVFTLLVISLLNLLVERFAPRLALNRPELLLIYSMACLGTVGGSRDFNQLLIPVMTWSFQMANPGNNWDALFNSDLPGWLTVRDPQALRGLYEGGMNLYQADILSAWVLPVAMWTVFATALVVVMICANLLIRKQWLDSEHLACPLVDLPVEISQPRRLMGRKLFWLGLGLAAALDTWNSFAMVYPTLPEVAINCVNIGSTVTARPWNAVGIVFRAFYPMVIGMGYLMPSDFLFSCWFFYLFWKVEMVVGAAFGLDQIRDFPFANFQGFGAYLLFAVYALWLGRAHLRRIYQSIVSPASGSADDQESKRYRMAVAGIAAGLAFLVWFSVRMGMQAWLGLVFFLIYYILAVAVTRMRAQFGAPIHDLSHTEPDRIITAVLGSRAIPRKGLIGMAMYFWFSRTYRPLPMTYQLEAIKMQERTGAGLRGVAQVLVAATTIGFIAATWASLHYNYGVGAAAEGHIISGQWTFAKLAGWLTSPEGTRWGPTIAIVVGGAVTLFLQTMRLRYVNWPFHPLGFALAGGFQMNVVWMQLLIAWLLKTGVIKYAGYKLYGQLMPFFLGLIVGQCLVGCIASTIGLILHQPLYKFLTMQ